MFVPLRCTNKLIHANDMIEISDLQFSYGPKTVLKNISLKASEGNIYGLLGENGVGKTTLLTPLCGLKKPQQGSITVDGRNPFDREPSLLSDQFYLADEVTPVHAKAMSFADISSMVAFTSTSWLSRMMMGSMIFSRSRTWWVEMMRVESSEVYFVTAFLNCALEGMSRPLVGSSI